MLFNVKQSKCTPCYNCSHCWTVYKLSYHPALQDLQANKEKLRCGETVASRDCCAVRVWRFSARTNLSMSLFNPQGVSCLSKMPFMWKSAWRDEKQLAFALTHVYFPQQSLKPKGVTEREPFPMTVSWCFRRGGFNYTELGWKNVNSKPRWARYVCKT